MKFGKLIIQALKIGIVCGLLLWMVQTGKLDFGQLKILGHYPEILLCSFALWAGGYVALGGARWFLLLKGLGLEIKYSKVVVLQLIGFFFNTAIPGAVGGDIIKAFYVIREQEGDRKTPAMLTILLDRLIGLSALFFVAALAICFQLQFFLSKPELFGLAIFGLGGATAIVLGFLWIMLVKDDQDPVAWILNGRFPGARIARGIYDALRSYRHQPIYVFYAFGISMVVQFAALMYAWGLTIILTESTPNLAIFFVIFPIAVMTTALPLAPGGLGVGHVAFDKLYALVGLSGGANVFNVMVLTQLGLNLLGFVPYLLYKKHGVLPNTVPTASDPSAVS